MRNKQKLDKSDSKTPEKDKSELAKKDSDDGYIIYNRPWTCDVCNAKYYSRSKLRLHMTDKHLPKKKPEEQTKTEEQKSEDPKKQSPKKEEDIKPKEPKKPEDSTPARTSKRLQLKRSGMHPDDFKKNVKTEFQCPVCNKVFPMLFSASKHVQKKHVEKEGKTDENLEPIRLDWCKLCSEMVEDEFHDCSQDEEVYKCIGCLKKFNSLPAFCKHITIRHIEDADFMSFKGTHDFSTWKVNTEAQVASRYSVFEKSTKEKYHQCNYVSPKNQKNITFLCPSAIVTQQLPNKLQVKYFKCHYGHQTPKYEIQAEYKKNIIIEKDDFQSIKNTHNAYQTLKTLLESIITDASKTNLENLKSLISMAIDMQYYVDKDDPEPATNKSMTDNQICTELETDSKKRRVGTPDLNGSKRVKFNDDAITKSPPSFNDSYMQFIDSSKEKEVIAPKRRSVRQYKPNSTKVNIQPEVEKKKPNILRPKNTKVKELNYEVREQENDCNILVLKI